jgi:hypothetical protein
MIYNKSELGYPHVSPEALEEFKQIWKRQFGEEISNKDAYDEASRLLRLFQVIYRPLLKKKGENNITN